MILAIDTSLGTSVAVATLDGAVIAAADSDDPRGHAETIDALIADALHAAGVRAPELTHVAAGMGPGPFTGLRVGVAAARAFAFGRGLPVIPVGSHDAVALEAGLFNDLTANAEETIAVVTDARRREYAVTAFHGTDADGIPLRLSPTRLVARDDLGAWVCSLAARMLEPARVPAGMVAVLAGRALIAGRTLIADNAIYLREPDATPRHVGSGR